MSSDDEEYENQFEDVENEDLSFGQFPARLFREGQISGQTFRFMMSTSGFDNSQSHGRSSMYSELPFQSMGASGTKFMLFFSPGTSSQFFSSSNTSRQSSRSLFQRSPSNLLELENSESTEDEGLGLGHSKNKYQQAIKSKRKGDPRKKQNGLNKQDVKGHDDYSDHEDNKDMVEIKGQGYKSSERGSKVEQNKEEIKGQNEPESIASSKVKRELSLHDNKPVAQMLHKNCEKTDEIIKNIWSSTSIQTNLQNEKSKTAARIDPRNLSEEYNHNFNSKINEREMMVSSGLHNHQVTNGECYHGDMDMDKSVGNDVKQTDTEKLRILNTKTIHSENFTRTDSKTTRNATAGKSEIGNFKSIQSKINGWSENISDDIHNSAKNEQIIQKLNDKGLEKQSHTGQIEATDDYFSSIEEDSCPTSFKVTLPVGGNSPGISIKNQPKSISDDKNQVLQPVPSIGEMKENTSLTEENEPSVFENKLLDLTKQKSESSIVTEKKKTTREKIESTDDTKRESEGKKKTAATGQNIDSQNFGYSDSTRSYDYNNFQEDDTDEFSSDFSSYGYSNYYDEEDRYGYMGYSGKSKKSKYGKFASGAKGLKTAFRRMQKMMTGMKIFADESGFQICDVSNDGNCMFAAVVDQLHLSGDFRFTTTSLRHAAVCYLQSNPCHEDGSHLASFLDHESWEEYLTRMDCDTEWGDHLILTAIVEVIQRCITVYNVSPTNKSDTTLKPSSVDSDQSEIVYLGHYGEEHFVSLRPKNWENTWYKKAALHAKKNKVNDDRTTGSEAQLNPEETVQKETFVKKEKNTKVLKSDSDIDIAENKACVDPVSDTPLPHLSYIINALLNSKCIHTSSASSGGVKFEPVNQSNSRVEMTGSVSEGLDYKLQDLSYYTKCACSEDPYHRLTHPSLTVHVYFEYKVGFSERGMVDQCDVAIVSNKCHPGYINLQIMSRKYKFGKFVQYVENRPMLKHLKTGIKGQESSPAMSKHLVTGLECPDFLPVASEWVWRSRPSHWPPDDIVQDIISKGCLLAAVAHPKSTNPEIEWQYLFSRAEIILATKALSQKQKYCFSVFKCLVDCHTRELEVKLSTNHLKTILFYACEVVSPTCWTDNAGGILLYMIQKLLESLQKRCLPNYFIKENNMIDHFSGETTRLLEEKIEALRMYPIMSMMFIAQRHGILCSSVLDEVIDDMEKYRLDGDLMETMQNIFVPTTMKLAQQYTIGGADYRKSYDIITTAYEQLLKFSKSDSSKNIPDFQEFLKKMIMSEKREKKRFLNAFYMDCFLKTSLLDSVCEGVETKTLQDLTGMDITDKYKNIKVPASFFSSSVSGVKFFDDLAFKLYTFQEYEDSAFFLRCGISKVKSALAEDNIDIADIVDEETKRDIGQQNYLRIQNLNMVFYGMLQHLLCCYDAIQQRELFFEYMEDLEELSDRMGIANVYSWVSDLWKSFGNLERANEAKKKMQMTTESAVGGCPCGRPNCASSALLVLM